MKVLVVKMSSLGDLVHTLPAITDMAAGKQNTELEIHWVAEEGFVSIPQLHPAVNKVIPIAWRRWRKNLWSARKEMANFFRQLRSENYDLIIDAQGLIKSAIVTRLARATNRAGYDSDSAREPLSSWFYHSKYSADKKSHAIDRVRTLFSLAAGYAVDLQRPRFGLQIRTLVSNYCLLLHGTTWENKHWPVEMWCDLASQMAEGGTHVLIPWGSAQEKAVAEKIASQHRDVEIMPATTLENLLETLAQAKCAVGVDSGLAHAAAAFGVPLVVVYGPTAERKTGARGEYTKNLQSMLSCSPCMRRTCGYRGERLMWQGHVVQPACFADVTPDLVHEKLQEQIFQANRDDLISVANQGKEAP